MRKVFVTYVIQYTCLQLADDMTSWEQQQKQSPGGVLKKAALKDFTKYTRRHLGVSFLVKLQGLVLKIYEKETPAQLFSYKFYNVFQDIFFIEKNSHWRCSLKKLFLKISQYLQEKKRLQHRSFPVNIAKFLRKSILKSICKLQPLYFLT